MSKWSHKLICNRADFETSCLSIWLPCLAFGFNKQKLDTIDNHISPHWCGPSIAYCGSNIIGTVMCLLYAPLCMNGAHIPPEIVQNAVAFGGSLGTACYAGNFRTRLREKYSIDGNLHADICTHIWCSPCALCQETMEINAQNRPFLYSAEINDSNDKFPYVQVMN